MHTSKVINIVNFKNVRVIYVSSSSKLFKKKELIANYGHFHLTDDITEAQCPIDVGWRLYIKPGRKANTIIICGSL